MNMKTIENAVYTRRLSGIPIGWCLVYTTKGAEQLRHLTNGFTPSHQTFRDSGLDIALDINFNLVSVDDSGKLNGFVQLIYPHDDLHSNRGSFTTEYVLVPIETFMKTPTSFCSKTFVKYLGENYLQYDKMWDSGVPRLGIDNGYEYDDDKIEEIKKEKLLEIIGIDEPQFHFWVSYLLNKTGAMNENGKGIPEIYLSKGFSFYAIPAFMALIAREYPEVIHMAYPYGIKSMSNISSLHLSDVVIIGNEKRNNSFKTLGNKMSINIGTDYNKLNAYLKGQKRFIPEEHLDEEFQCIKSKLSDLKFDYNKSLTSDADLEEKRKKLKSNIDSYERLVGDIDSGKITSFNQLLEHPHFINKFKEEQGLTIDMKLPYLMKRQVIIDRAYNNFFQAVKNKYEHEQQVNNESISSTQEKAVSQVPNDNKEDTANLEETFKSSKG